MYRKYTKQNMHWTMYQIYCVAVTSNLINNCWDNYQQTLPRSSNERNNQKDAQMTVLIDSTMIVKLWVLIDYEVDIFGSWLTYQLITCKEFDLWKKNS